MDSQTAGRRCYIELDLNTDDSVLKTESIPKDFIVIIQKLQTEVKNRPLLLKKQKQHSFI